jgi:hypothetical protein
MIQEYKKEMELNWIHQLWVYGDEINLLGKIKNMIKKYTKTLLHVSKEISL